MEEDQVIEGSESFREIKGGFGFKEIALRQVAKVVAYGSKEFVAGFYVYSQPSAGQSSQRMKYIGDTRHEFVQSIDMLHDLLISKFDNEMNEQSDNFEKRLPELLEKYQKKKEEGVEKVEREYWGEKIKLYRLLFQQLVFFLERLGWLEGREIQD